MSVPCGFWRELLTDAPAVFIEGRNVQGAALGHTRAGLGYLRFAARGPNGDPRQGGVVDDIDWRAKTRECDLVAAQEFFQLGGGSVRDRAAQKGIQIGSVPYPQDIRREALVVDPILGQQHLR